MTDVITRQPAGSAEERSRGPFVVIGAGLAGAATAWRLAAAGEQVTLIEARQPANPAASSHGSARIFRHAYPDRFHVELTVRALAGWRELESEADERLLRTTGGLDFGSTRDLDSIATSLDALGLEWERLGPEGARARWPHLAFDGPVLYQPAAGVIDADLAVRSMVALAEQRGAAVVREASVERVERVGAGFRVHGSTASFDAGAVIVCVGAWLPELLDALPVSASIRAALPQLTVTQQQTFHFALPDPQAEWPIFVHDGELNVYALPGGRDVGDAAFKIAEHDGGSVTTASGRDGIVGAAARDRIVRYVERYLPGVPPEPFAESTCLYTSTPSERFLIDEFDGLVIASPCSGHGAKFAPLLGELIAGAALGVAPPEPFRLRAHSEPLSELQEPRVRSVTRVADVSSAGQIRPPGADDS